MSADPDDLDDRLARRTCPEPSGDFRARVLLGMAAARDAPPPGDALWSLIRRVAAAVVVALNVGMAASNAVRFQALTPPAPAPGGTAPYHTDAEPALATVARAPDAGPLARRLFSHEEDDEWDTP